MPPPADWRIAAAAELLVETLPALRPESPVLLLGERHPDVPEAFGSMSVRTWSRRLAEHARVSPWPPTGPFCTAAVRLPKARAELEMTLHAAAAALAPEGRVVLYGAKDEGIRSAAKRLEPIFADVATVAIGNHCRVLTAVRPGSVAALRSTLEDWRETFDPRVPGLSSEWVSYPGVFAHGALDAGTATLVEALDAAADLVRGRVLDYGCGSGILAGYASARGAVVDMMDVDSVALEAAGENVPDARAILGADLGASRPPYDLVVSNPPIHEGKAESLSTVMALVRDAPDVLAPGGSIVLVGQRRLPLARGLEEAFGDVALMADDRFRVWRARA